MNQIFDDGILTRSICYGNSYGDSYGCGDGNGYGDGTGCGDGTQEDAL